MGPGLPNLLSIQNPRSYHYRFEHTCAAQLHMTQAREPERYIFALQPFPTENGLLMLSCAAHFQFQIQHWQTVGFAAIRTSRSLACQAIDTEPRIRSR